MLEVVNNPKFVEPIDGAAKAPTLSVVDGGLSDTSMPVGLSPAAAVTLGKPVEVIVAELTPQAA